MRQNIQSWKNVLSDLTSIGKIGFDHADSFRVKDKLMKGSWKASVNLNLIQVLSLSRVKMCIDKLVKIVSIIN